MAGKNKGHQKGEVSHLLKQVKDEWREFRKNVVSSTESFQKQWAGKFNDLNDRFKKLTIGMAQQLAGMGANQQIHSDVIEKLDIHDQVISKMLRDIYGRLEHIQMYYSMMPMPLFPCLVATIPLHGFQLILDCRAL